MRCMHMMHMHMHTCGSIHDLLLPTQYLLLLTTFLLAKAAAVNHDTLRMITHY